MIQKGNQKHLTFEQRVEIEKGLTGNQSFSRIAKTIGKDPSTVSKEVIPQIQWNFPQLEFSFSFKY